MFYEPSSGREFASLHAFRLEYKDTSFGDLNTEAERNACGLFALADAPPAFNPLTEARMATGFEQQGNGTWARAYAVVPLSAEALQANLPIAKAAKNDEINAARLAANTTSFEHAGKRFACDTLSRGDIDGTNGYVALYDALPPGWPGGWKAVDNTYLEIADVAAWRAFYTSMFAQGNANFVHAQTLKQALAAAQTIEEVEAITW